MIDQQTASPIPRQRNRGILEWLHSLTRDEVCVFLVLDRAARRGVNQLSQNSIALEAGTTEFKVEAAVRGLTARRLVRVFRRSGRANVYELADVPLPHLVTRSNAYAAAARPPNDAA